MALFRAGYGPLDADTKRPTRLDGRARKEGNLRPKSGCILVDMRPVQGLRGAVKKIAADRGQSVASFVRQLLADYCREVLGVESLVPYTDDAPGVGEEVE